MRDEKGTYYYPNPMEKRTRMYVRKKLGNIEYRLFSPDSPEIWERHGWLTRDAVEAAVTLRVQEGGDDTPLALYDERVAAALLKDGSPL